jgi:putative endonuclease
MWKVYAIRSEVNGMIYVGMCSNLERRLKEHNDGRSKFTKAYRPWRLIYTEEAADRVSARAREKYWKSGIGKEFLKSIKV